MKTFAELNKDLAKFSADLKLLEQDLNATRKIIRNAEIYLKKIDADHVMRAVIRRK